MHSKHQAIAVYGAGGHTGRFVVDELRRRGLAPVAVGRSAATLPAGVPARVAAIDDAQALERAFAGCAVVINCAGPFMDTAAPIAAAALRNGAHYLDVSAEQASAHALFGHDEQARAAGVALIPAAGFYGGLADLLATALITPDDGPVDAITTAIALDHWWPTQGTRITGARNTAPRLVVEDGRLVPMALPARTIDWTFGAPLGRQAMVELSFSEVVTMARHLPVRAVHSYLNTAALQELRDTATPPPSAADPDGRSAQLATMEVVARQAGRQRRAIARGRDIYAVSAPIVVEAAQRMLSLSFTGRGALALGQAFDARAVLAALAPAHLALDFLSA